MKTVKDIQNLDILHNENLIRNIKGQNNINCLENKSSIYKKKLPFLVHWGLLFPQWVAFWLNKNINFEADHPLNISDKFGLNWPSSLGKEDKYDLTWPFRSGKLSKLTTDHNSATVSIIGKFYHVTALHVSSKMKIKIGIKNNLQYRVFIKNS